LQVLNVGTMSTDMFCADFTTTRRGCIGFPGRSCPSASGPPCDTRSAGRSPLQNIREGSSVGGIPKSWLISNSYGTWVVHRRIPASVSR
jgi:hypothetical protein